MKAKKVVALALSAAMIMAGLAGCGTATGGGSAAAGTDAQTEGTKEEGSKGGSGDLEGADVFMFKSTGNTFGDLMFEGFEEVCTAAGRKAVYKSPAETTVAAQVQLLDELITQKVASITISTNGDAGYDEVFKKAQDAGIPIVSVDSSASVDYRVTHINPTSQEGIGSKLVQAAVLISLGVDYPDDGDMEKAIETALGEYTGEELVLGVLSASIDTPVQNGWIAMMEKELQKPVYAGKVAAELDKKYGNDDLTESTTQAQAFVAENKVNCIISPTTVGIAAAGQVLTSDPNSKIGLTGLGLPSEMQSFMPAADSDKAFDFPCPYMMLWDVVDLGRVAAGATLGAIDGSYDGKVGSTFSLDAFGEYEARTFETIECEDGGTQVYEGDPYVFYKGNMAEWVDKL